MSAQDSKANVHKHVADVKGPKAADDATVGQLVAEASRDLSALIQAEVQLAKNELSFSAKAGGIGAGLFFLAGFMAAVVLVLASIGLALVLDLWLPVSASFFIVAGTYLLIAVIAVLVGIHVIKKVKAPTATIATAKELPSAFKPDA
jgi:uncharacterized membrane protein